MGIMNKIKETVLVLFSGGQDSTTCLMQAREQYEKVEAITFDYGQKHSIELQSADNICGRFAIPITIIETAVFQQINHSALLEGSVENVNKSHEGNINIPASFVPGRNLYFLTVACMLAYKKGIKIIMIGVSQEDYSGYPDCRQNALITLNQALCFGMDYDIHISMPFISMTKVDEINIMMNLPDGKEALSMTHTCYNGQYPPCGVCNACKLRADAFKKSGFNDPLIERYKEYRLK